MLIKEMKKVFIRPLKSCFLQFKSIYLFRPSIKTYKISRFHETKQTGKAKYVKNPTFELCLFIFFNMDNFEQTIQIRLIFTGGRISSALLRFILEKYIL